MNTPPRKQTLAVVVAWIVVGVPLAWGVCEVFVKSLDLFR